MTKRLLHECTSVILIVFCIGMVVAIVIILVMTLPGLLLLCIMFKQTKHKVKPYAMKYSNTK